MCIDGRRRLRQRRGSPIATTAGLRQLARKVLNLTREGERIKIIQGGAYGEIKKNVQNRTSGKDISQVYR